MTKKVKLKKGVKHDVGKPMMDLVEPSYILGTADVLTYGAQEYAPNNWKHFKPEEVRRMYAALQRHLLAYAMGEMYDQKSGRLHLDHASCELMFLRWWFTARGYGMQGKWSK